MSMSSIRICVQLFMYRMHALYIVELAVTSHSRLCGIEVVRDSSVTSHTVHHTREEQIATNIMYCCTPSPEHAQFMCTVN